MSPSRNLGAQTKGPSGASSLIVHFESLQYEIIIIPFVTGVINTHLPTSEKGGIWLSATIFRTSYILLLYYFYLSLGRSINLTVGEVLPGPPPGGALFAGKTYEEEDVSCFALAIT